MLVLPMVVLTVAGEHSMRSLISLSVHLGGGRRPGRLLPGREWMHPTAKGGGKRERE